MPIYEFKCKDCDNEFEMICSANDDTGDIACPRCGERKVEKIISLFSSSCGSSGSCSAPASSPFT